LPKARETERTKKSLDDDRTEDDMSRGLNLLANLSADQRHLILERIELRFDRVIRERFEADYDAGRLATIGQMESRILELAEAQEQDVVQADDCLAAAVLSSEPRSIFEIYADKTNRERTVTSGASAKE
jgi:hypothetical protein